MKIFLIKAKDLKKVSAMCAKADGTAPWGKKTAADFKVTFSRLREFKKDAYLLSHCTSAIQSMACEQIGGFANVEIDKIINQLKAHKYSIEVD
jgi:hypothetical protein